MSAPRDSTATSVFPLAAGARYLVSVDRLRRGDSPRSGGEDHRHIARLVESETPWPPILVHRSTMRVIDGMHRLRAARIKGLAQIEVEFFDGDAAEAFVRGVELNTAHGLPLALSDRKAAAERIVDSMPQLSDRAIATYTGLSAKTIAAIRRRSSVEIPQSNARIGADGRRRPTDAAHRRQRVLELLTSCPDMSLRKLAAAAEVSISTAHAVRKRLREQQPQRRAASVAPRVSRRRIRSPRCCSNSAAIRRCA